MFLPFSSALAAVCQSQARIAVRGITVLRAVNVTCPAGVSCTRPSAADFASQTDLSEMSALVKKYSDLRYDNYEVALSVCALGTTAAECNRYCAQDCKLAAAQTGLAYQEYVNAVNDTPMAMQLQGSYVYVCRAAPKEKPRLLPLEGWKTAVIVLGVLVFVGLVVWLTYGLIQYLLEKYKERANSKLLRQTGEDFSATRAKRTPGIRENVI